ncbi:OmpH family outer membrane protein [Marinilongibacter aquaticus]|uniref:OmpH family outer membrane protein n=1 Tax=Marinilongibacter aquaticus TaxID=2975157 RepID=UPI0021BD9100|nr:OmpH family outer membrane protein [Marinilongibacter aquaticus]UBM60099.1 OmpH family outer membrane protein [Marinilongibacter aquaticus]
MKKSLFFLFLSLLSVNGIAQKFGYIDSDYILSKMPEYKEAVESMNTYSEEWVKDIQTKYREVEGLKLKYQEEEILLTDAMRKEREGEIARKEEEVKNLNNQVFGLNGQLFLKKKEIMKPIMDMIYVACEKVARQKKLMFIFDKASDLTMIYTDPRHDYTDYVLEAMGIAEENKK